VLSRTKAIKASAFIGLQIASVKIFILPLQKECHLL